VLPAQVSKYSDIHYHRSSPYSGQGQPTTDQTLGDLHQWNVWHGSQQPWHNWDILAGRFVSEFGMEGYPDIRTVDYWLGGDTKDRHPQSRLVCMPSMGGVLHSYVHQDYEQSQQGGWL
jgi:beta-mannosidase